MSIEVIEGDTTRLDDDAIVNAVNTTLLGGGGVDGAIHRAAGPELLKECHTLEGCPTGEARITRGHNLKARHVIHTVGSVWHGGDRGEDDLLAGCYRNSLLLADENGVASMAFPSISTGAYRFPMERAVGIAVREIRKSLTKSQTVKRVVLCCFGEESLRYALLTGAAFTPWAVWHYWRAGKALKEMERAAA